MLHTSRLTLRRLESGDLPALRAILQDPLAMVAYEGVFSDAECVEWLERQQRRYADNGMGLQAVLRDGEMIGQCGITLQQVEDDEVTEVGYLFRRDTWHRGYAVEAASACRDWAFETLGVPEVYAKVRDTNIPSMNVAIRLGMTVRRRFVTRYRGVDMPHYAFAIDRTSWERRLRRLHSRAAPPTRHEPRSD